MRQFARITVLASTIAIAAAVGAVELAPIASAQDEAPAPVTPFGSSMQQSPDLVVTLGTVCVAKDVKDAESEKVAALEIVVENVGAGDATLVAGNYAVVPDAPGVINEDSIAAGSKVTYTIPSELTEWVSRPGGVAVFSPQLDANYANNFAVGLLSVDCAPEEVPAGE